jgi:N-acetylmuramoyl-L-alanine amidase
VKGKQGVLAMVGLGILFICVWCGYYQSLQWEDGMQVMAKESTATADAVSEVSSATTEVAVASGYPVNDENQQQTEMQVVQPKVYKYRNVSRNLMLTQEDYDNLLRIVEAEATGGTIKSKKMVANVVLNRVNDSHFPDSVTAVVWQRSSDGTAQFSPTTDGRFYSVTVTKETKKAVNEVLKGSDEAKGALFFVNRKTASYRSLCWFDSRLNYLFECGGHTFYGYTG